MDRRLSAPLYARVRVVTELIQGSGDVHTIYAERRSSAVLRAHKPNTSRFVSSFRHATLRSAPQLSAAARNAPPRESCVRVAECCGVLRIRADTHRSQCKQAFMLVASTCFPLRALIQHAFSAFPEPRLRRNCFRLRMRSTKAACSQLELCVAVH